MIIITIIIIIMIITKIIIIKKYCELNATKIDSCILLKKEFRS